MKPKQTLTYLLKMYSGMADLKRLLQQPTTSDVLSMLMLAIWESNALFYSINES